MPCPVPVARDRLRAQAPAPPSEVGRARFLFADIKDLTSDFDPWGGWTNRPARKRAYPPGHVRDSAAVALARHHAKMRPEHAVENELLLEDMALRLKARGVRLLLVTIPVSKYYAQGMDPAAYQRMQLTLGRFASNNGAAYLNYTFDPRFSDEDFHDADHLNLAGARKFSLLLRQEGAGPGPGAQLR